MWISEHSLCVVECLALLSGFLDLRLCQPLSVSLTFSGPVSLKLCLCVCHPPGDSSSLTPHPRGGQGRTRPGCAEPGRGRVSGPAELRGALLPPGQGSACSGEKGSEETAPKQGTGWERGFQPGAWVSMFPQDWEGTMARVPWGLSGWTMARVVSGTPRSLWKPGGWATPSVQDWET